MKFAPEIGRKATPAPTGRKDARTSFGARLPSGARGRPYKVGWDLDRIVRDGMEKVVWIYRSVDAIARNWAKLPIVVRDGHPEMGAPIEDHPLLPLFNYRPNPFESAWEFRYRASSILQLSKMGVQIEVIPNALGDAAALYLLPPGRTYPVPDPSRTRMIARWEVDLGGGKSKAVPADRVIWVRVPHPTDPYSGQTPFQAAGLDLDTDFMARLYNREFLRRDARPGGILGVDGQVDDDVSDEIKARMGAGGPGSSGEIVVLETGEGGITWTDTSVTPRDAQYVESRQLSKEAILAANGTPETVLGNASQRTWDNAETEKGVFWEETMDGHVTLWGSALDPLDGDPKKFVRADLSGITVLQRRKRERDEFYLEEFKAGARTLNSYLAATGQDTIEDPMADSHWLAMGLVAAMTGSNPAMAKALLPAGAPEEIKALVEGAAPVPLGGAPSGAHHRGQGQTESWLT